MDEQEIRGVLTAAVERLQREEAKIIGADVAERTICACLAAILQQSFPDHSVHVEYNRHFVHRKEIRLPDVNGNLVSKRVFPDIIVHQPGCDDNNLLVIEVKKTTNQCQDHEDIYKLQLIKEQIRYQFAAFIRLPFGPNADPDDFRLIWL